MAFNVESFRKKTYELFCENFTGEVVPEPTIFCPFMCPVAMAEALVDEEIYEDYGVLELLILRLYALGIRDVQELADLSGMPLRMIERVLFNEEFVYHHIDSTKQSPITETGRKTIEENQLGNENGESSQKGPRSYSMYETIRRMHIEAATGTVIPGYLECDLRYMRSILPENLDGIVPRESVDMDKELEREINARLLEYKHKDILNEGDTIRKIRKIHSSRIMYRWACLARFEGMRYPMVVMEGRRYVDKLNMNSLRQNKFGYSVAVPLSVAEADKEWLLAHGFDLENVIIRSSEKFDYLEETTQLFGHHAVVGPIEDIPVVYEDELIMCDVEEECQK